MGATLLTLALLGPGVAEDQKCRWVERPIAPFTHRVLGQTVVIKPYLIAKPRPKTKHLKQSKRQGFDSNCDDVAAMRAEGPTMLPPVVAPADFTPAIAEPIPVFQLPDEPTGAGPIPVVVPDLNGPGPSYTSIPNYGAPAVVLGGYSVVAEPVPAVPEPHIFVMFLAGAATLFVWCKPKQQAAR